MKLNKHVLLGTTAMIALGLVLAGFDNLSFAGGGGSPCPPSTPSPPSPPPSNVGRPGIPQGEVDCANQFGYGLQILAKRAGMTGEEYKRKLRRENGIPEWSNWLPHEIVYAAWAKAFHLKTVNMCDLLDPVHKMQPWPVPHPAVVGVLPLVHSWSAPSGKPFEPWHPRWLSGQ